ncbi:MAG TPA: murein L,D-transpeptidase catalytic domain family protein [Chitinophagaceae bacterium]|jgi:hypothetical protein
MHLLKKPAAIALSFLVSFLFIFATPIKSAKKVITSAPVAIHEDNAALFSELHLDQMGMSQDAFSAAMYGLEKLNGEGLVQRDDIITVIDFSQPSNKKRLYVLDLVKKRILFNTLVAHGRNSGDLWATSFSNDLSSLKSSPGFYVTGETYRGDNGYSLRLDGLEKDINDNARSREIVLHGASYVNESAVNALGFLGRSLGCPAVPTSKHRAIINTIKQGTCLFIYSPDKDYLQNSLILNS